MERVNVTLDDEYAEKLRLLAEQRYLQPGTMARALLSEAIDMAELNGARMAALLDAIPGAWEDVEQGIEDVRAGRSFPLEELDERLNGSRSLQR